MLQVSNDARNYNMSTTAGPISLSDGDYENPTIVAVGDITSANGLSITGGSSSATNFTMSSASTFVGHDITTTLNLNLISTSTTSGAATWTIGDVATLDDLTQTDLILSASTIRVSNGTFTRGIMRSPITFTGASTVDGTTFDSTLTFAAGGTFQNATVTGAANLNSVRDTASTFASTLSTAIARTTNGPALPFFQVQSRASVDFIRTNFGTELNVTIPAGSDDHFIIMDGVDGTGCTINKVGTNTGILYILGTSIPTVGDIAPTFGFTLGTGVQFEPVPTLIFQNTRIDINGGALTNLTGRYELRSADTSTATVISSGTLASLATPLRFTSATTGETLNGNTYVFNSNVLPASGNAEWILVANW